MKVGTSHRPTSAQCHHNGKKPESEQGRDGASLGPEEVSEKSHEERVLLAPIMHRSAFEFVGRFGSPVQEVKGCVRRGVILPISRIRSFICEGGGLEKVARPVNKPIAKEETIIPMVAIYPVYSSGASGKGQAYQISEHLLVTT